MKNRADQSFLSIFGLSILSRSRIGRRLVLTTILFSFFITLFTTSYQLFTDYKKDIETIHTYFSVIKDSYLESLANSVWMFDEELVMIQLNGLIKLPDMESLEIQADGISFRTSGTLKSTHTLSREFPLVFERRNQKLEIGVLKATASLDNVYKRLIGKAFSILIGNGVLAVFVSCFFLFIFHIFVTRRLIRLAEHLKNIDFETYPEKIHFEKEKAEQDFDEIDRVIHALNRNQVRLYELYEALKNSQDELYRIFTMSIDLICVADINTSTFVKVNPAFTEVLGFSEKELKSKPFLAFIHPDDIQLTRQTVEKELRAGSKVINFENRYQCKDGSYRWLRWVSHPEPEKGVTYAIAHDITEIKISVNELEKAHQRFLTVLDSIDAHIYVSDMKTYEILFVNAKMQQEYGKDLIGRFCYESLCGESEPCPQCTNRKIVDAAGQPGDVFAWQGKNPLTGKWYMYYDRAIQWVDGNIVRLQIAMDITPLKAMEAELRQAQKMESIGNLAGGIAHDFNNLLFPIVGMSELLLHDLPKDSPEYKNAFEILKAGKRGRELVKQILAFSRHAEQEKKPVRIQQVLEEVFRLIRSTIPSDIEIFQNINPDCGPVFADPTQIHQVAMNLITNAYHAVNHLPGGKITVRLEEAAVEADTPVKSPFSPGRYVVLSVADTGGGIRPDIKDKIFEPYFTTKERGKGTGLGLAVVYGIVREHGGDILVDSEPGKETVFTVYLPLIEEEAGTDFAEREKLLRKGSERILVVDDDISVVMLETQMLTLLGYRTAFCTGSLDALEMFRDDPDGFDLVITDMTMPDMTGDQLAQKMMSIKPGLPVIICTGFSDKMDEERSISAGIKGFLMKPVGMSDMSEVIEKALNEAGESA